MLLQYRRRASVKLSFSLQGSVLFVSLVDSYRAIRCIAAVNSLRRSVGSTEFVTLELHVHTS